MPSNLNNSGWQQCNWNATQAPGVNDDETAGYSFGSLWRDTTNDKMYTCIDPSTGAAVWQDQGAGAVGATGAQGDKGLNWQGAWSGATAYVIDDAVVDNGSAYVCTAGHTNQQPPNVSYWDVLASKGDQGDQGIQGETGADGAIGLTWLGAWSNVTAYVANDAVEEAGTGYVCTTGHTNQQPPNASYWDVLASKGTDGSITAVTGAAPITSTGGSAPEIGVTAATTAASGVVELATQAEVDAGVDTTRAVTPDTLAGSTLFVQDLQVATAVDAPTTTSSTFVDLPNMTLTTSNSGNADYLITFSMNIANSSKSKIMDIEILIGGVAQAASLRSSTTSAADATNELSTSFAASAVADGTIIKVQWRTTGTGGGGTATAGARTLVIQGR